METTKLLSQWVRDPVPNEPGPEPTLYVAICYNHKRNYTMERAPGKSNSKTVVWLNIFDVSIPDVLHSNSFSYVLTFLLVRFLRLFVTSSYAAGPFYSPEENITWIL